MCCKRQAVWLLKEKNCILVGRGASPTTSDSHSRRRLLLTFCPYTRPSLPTRVPPYTRPSLSREPKLVVRAEASRNDVSSVSPNSKLEQQTTQVTVTYLIWYTGSTLHREIAEHARQHVCQCALSSRLPFTPVCLVESSVSYISASLPQQCLRDAQSVPVQWCK